MIFYAVRPEIIKEIEANTTEEAEMAFKEYFYASGEPRGFLMNENGDVLLDCEHKTNITISEDENNGE